MQIGGVNPFVQATAANRSQASARSGGAAGAAAGFEAALAGATQTSLSAVDDTQRYAPKPGNPLTYLTPADRRLLAETTGFNVSSEGEVQNSGRKTVDPVIFVMATDREAGRLQGDVTPGYLTELFGKYKDDAVMGGSFSDAVLARALDHLASERLRRAEGTPASSFNVGL